MNIHLYLRSKVKIYGAESYAKDIYNSLSSNTDFCPEYKYLSDNPSKFFSAFVTAFNLLGFGFKKSSQNCISIFQFPK